MPTRADLEGELYKRSPCDYDCINNNLIAHQLTWNVWERGNPLAQRAIADAIRFTIQSGTIDWPTVVRAWHGSFEPSQFSRESDVVLSVQASSMDGAYIDDGMAGAALMKSFCPRRDDDGCYKTHKRARQVFLSTWQAAVPVKQQAMRATLVRNTQDAITNWIVTDLELGLTITPMPDYPTDVARFRATVETHCRTNASKNYRDVRTTCTTEIW